MNKQTNQLNSFFIAEYRDFLKKYLFRLLGIPHCKLYKCRYNYTSKDCVSIKNKRIYFSAAGQQLFWIAYDPVLTADNLRLAKVVIEAFFQFSEHQASKPEKHNNLIEAQRKNKIYNMAIQVGICSWITGSSESKRTEQLFNILEQWSVKTYEGRNVTMGFVIDPNRKSSIGLSSREWLSFLDDDCSAVLSDCIHSIFELDQNCNFLGYRSITEQGTLPYSNLNEKVPLRFMNIVQQFVPEDPENEKTNRVGIFLLANGDIILAKDGVTRFVKRNLQWLNLSYDAFRNGIEGFLQNTYGDSIPDIAEKLILNIYASVLDVSFSHTGGIIAIVGDKWEVKTDGLAPVDTILNVSDNLILSEENILKKQKEDNCGVDRTVLKERQADQNKRAVKRKIIRHMINQKSFVSLDRKLRSELIALDGACILKPDGTIYSFGAIIQNDSGSSGGGRAAAAKKLSQYGMAVKVSTDGYIELYVNSVPVYTIK